MVGVERFATGYFQPVAKFRGRRDVVVKASDDGDSRPWRVRISTREPVRVCKAASA
jgi:hypothetical protein